MTQLFSYMTRAIEVVEEQFAERGQPIFGAKLKAWRHKPFKFSPLLIWYVFAITNPFSWIMNAFSSGKRCLTSMAFWLQADCRTNLPPFQGARPYHVRVKSSSFCFPRELVSFDPWYVTRPPPIGKGVWVGRYNKLSYRSSYLSIIALPLSISQMEALPFDPGRSLKRPCVLGLYPFTISPTLPWPDGSSSCHLLIVSGLPFTHFHSCPIFSNPMYHLVGVVRFWISLLMNCHSFSVSMVTRSPPLSAHVFRFSVHVLRDSVNT